MYLSAYFERHRTAYYDLLRRVSQNSEWTEWVEFFMDGVIQGSNEAIRATNRFLDLRTRYEQKLIANRASGNAVILAMRLFSNPVVTIPMAAEYLDTGYPSAKKAVMHLVRTGILEQVGTGKRNKEYVAREIVSVFS